MRNGLLKIPFAKVTRAREQLNGLQLEFQRFSDSKPYTLTEDTDIETGERILIYHPNAPIPNDWAIELGQIFYALRSALDNAIQELTIRKNGSALKDTEFPIFNDPDKFSALKKNGDPAPASGLSRVRGMEQTTQVVIEALQPYHVTGVDQVSILWLLHELNIFDKHRDGFLCRQLAHKTKINVLDDIPHFLSWRIEIGANLDERAIVARIQTTEPLQDGKMYMDGDIALDITFDQSCCASFKKQEAVIGLTAAIIDGVETVLHKLEASVTP